MRSPCGLALLNYPLHLIHHALVDVHCAEETDESEACLIIRAHIGHVCASVCLRIRVCAVNARVRVRMYASVHVRLKLGGMSAFT